VGSEKARNRQKLLGVALDVALGAEGLRGNGSARLWFNTNYSTNAKRRFRKCRRESLQMRLRRREVAAKE
jgi:hypothetical protein